MPMQYCSSCRMLFTTTDPERRYCSNACKPKRTSERGQRGAAHHKAKLTDHQVREIRARYAEGGITERALAKAFGIAQPNIHLILHRKRWAHVE